MVDVAVFMDWQNVYRSAREAFEMHQAPNERGVFDPLALARHLAAANKRGTTGRLVQVEIHRGQPQSNADPKGHGAVAKQAQAWMDQAPDLVSVRLRPLAYNPTTGEHEEKGVDVALACSALEWVLTDRCQIAIIFSHDSDLLPAIETICRLRGDATHVETASWKGDFFHKRIPPAKNKWNPHHGVVNHTLKVEVFDKVETAADYSK
jgi:uncharacterized LabA/DUF88 family protein